jgi:AI-2 transport protein TqsA
MNASRSGRMLVSAAALVVVLAGVRSASGIVGPMVLALALTALLHPLRARLAGRMPTWAASVVVLLGAYLLIVVLTLALVVSAAQLASLVPTYAKELDDLSGDIHSALRSLGFDGSQADAGASALDVGRLVDGITAIMEGIVSLLSSFFLVLTLMLFMAFDGASTERLAAGARQHRPRLVGAMESFAQGTRTYLGVSAVFGLIVAAVDTAMLWALGVPGAFVWGALAFVTNFIPNIGFVIGLLPPALVALLEGGPTLMVVVVVLYCVVNLVIQSIIQPRFVGSAVGLSTTLTFLSLVFWAWVLGPIGALLAVPMSLLVKALLVEADPEGAWLAPLVSGRPDDPGPAPAPTPPA